MASKTLGRVQSVSKGRSKSKSKASEYLYIAEEIPPEEKIQALNAKLQAIQQELVFQQEQNQRVQLQRSEMKKNIEIVNSQLETQREENLAILSDMSRQYKMMQQELIDKNNDLEKQVMELKEQLGILFISVLNQEIALLVIDETKKDRTQRLAEKDATIAEQQSKMEQMALEFTDMLRQTLERMGDKIEEAAKRGNDSVLIPTEYASKLRTEFNIQGKV